MMTISDHDRFYWKYEYDVVEKHLLPLLREWGVSIEKKTLLDVGCGDGGGMSALYDAGMKCKGFDIEAPRIALAEALRGGRTFEAIVGNIYKEPIPFDGETFDLVVLHDVYEHLEKKVETLRTLQRYMKPDGFLFITFPPYYSAFGAHQQLLKSNLGKLPFFHLLPFALTKILPALKNEYQPFVDEIQKLGRMKMGIAKFEEYVRESGLKILKKKLYLISPNHIRFGLTPVSAGVVGEIPLLQELLVSGVVYLLQKG
jgi:SAM-dependent methyltransferase